MIVGHRRQRGAQPFHPRIEDLGLEGLAEQVRALIGIQPLVARAPELVQQVRRGAERLHDRTAGEQAGDQFRGSQQARLLELVREVERADG